MNKELLKGGLRKKKRSKMANKIVLGAFALALIAVLGFGAVSALGYGEKLGFGKGFGYNKGTLTEEEKSKILEQKEAIREAIETQDFQAWKSLMESHIEQMRSKLTEENFNALVEKHAEMSEFKQAIQEAKESQDFEKVQELMEQYGFQGKGKPGFRFKGQCPYHTAEK